MDVCGNWSNFEAINIRRLNVFDLQGGGQEVGLGVQSVQREQIASTRFRFIRAKDSHIER